MKYLAILAILFTGCIDQKKQIHAPPRLKPPKEFKVKPLPDDLKGRIRLRKEIRNELRQRLAAEGIDMDGENMAKWLDSVFPDMISIFGPFGFGGGVN